MNNNLGKIIAKSSAFLKLVYDSVKKAFEWEKENTVAWIIKGIIAIATVVLSIIFIRAIPYIFALTFLLYIVKDSHNPSSTLPHAPNYTEMGRTVSEILCRVLHSNFEVLNIKKPENLSQILPVNYSAINSLNGQVFFRFIIQHNPNKEDDFNEMKELINIKISQLLQEGFPNINYPFYNDLPCIYVFDIQKDLQHGRHYYLDVMPIINSGSYSFIKSRIQKQLTEEKESVDSSTLYDDDF